MTELPNNWTMFFQNVLALAPYRFVPTLYFKHDPCYHKTMALNYLTSPGVVKCYICNDSFELDETDFQTLLFVA